MKKIIIIAGPTASGKTSFAIDLAKQIGGEIINADSLQVYKENPIISAQPTLQERQNIPHHLFGYVNGDEDYTVARWINDAKAKIAAIKTPILVGGSGFYLKHLIFGLSNIPDIPDRIRIAARALHSEIGNLEFYKLLKEIDPLAASKLEPNNYTRVLRAYEVIQLTGKSVYEWQGDNIIHFPISSFSLMILQPERQVLYQNCDKRFLDMLDNGALEEVRYLMQQNYRPSSGVMKSHGVPELIKYLSGEWSLEQAISRSQQVVRNYAKRQTTWFKHQFNHPELAVTAIKLPRLLTSD